MFNNLLKKNLLSLIFTLKKIGFLSPTETNPVNIYKFEGNIYFNYQDPFTKQRNQSQISLPQ